MKQCLHCAHRLFFKLFGNDGYTCCFSHGETVKDIDIKTGFSPATLKHGLKEVPCSKFSQGSSIFEPPADKPFLIHPVRKAGEKYLQKILTNSYQI